jgi:predicted PurR-regulated permease PerM
LSVSGKVTKKGGGQPRFSARVPKPENPPRTRVKHIVPPETDKTTAAELDWTSRLAGMRIVLITIATVCVVMFLHYAKDLLIPVVAALVLAACLGPVAGLIRRIIPYDSVSAATTILATLLVIGGATFLVSDDLTLALERLPDVSKQLKDRVSLEPATSKSSQENS